MFRTTSQAGAPTKRRLPTKLIAGFAALSMTAIITASGFAAAATVSKPSKQECLAAGFTNYGQCVKEWAHHKNHPGNGYGGNGGNSVAVNVTLNHSNNNIINIIVGIFN